MRSYKPLNNSELHRLEHDLRSSFAEYPSTRELATLIEQAKRANQLLASLEALFGPVMRKWPIFEEYHTAIDSLEKSMKSFSGV